MSVKFVTIIIIFKQIVSFCVQNMKFSFKIVGLPYNVFVFYLHDI